MILEVKTMFLALLLAFLFSEGKADCPVPVLKDTIILSSESAMLNELTENLKLDLECANGYEVESGSSSITCVGGTWTDIELNCKKKDCGEPRSSPHMTYTFSAGTLFGAYAQARCDRGYYLEGSSYRQCLVSGWSGRSRCLMITCPQPADLQDGHVIVTRDEHVLDDVVYYACDPGYILVGNRSITCREDGEYDSPPPICKAVECPVPGVTFGIQIEGNPPYFYKSEVKFECTTGYSIKGSSTAACEENGWSVLPVCDEDLKTDPTTGFTHTMSTPAAFSTSLRDLKTEPTAGFTHTLSTPAASSTSLHGKHTEQLAANSTLTQTTLMIFSVSATICIVAVICYVCYSAKRKGSYNTGEDLRRKEELLLSQSP